MIGQLSEMLAKLIIELVLLSVNGGIIVISLVYLVFTVCLVIYIISFTMSKVREHWSNKQVTENTLTRQKGLRVS